jgi:hypothetical protein
MACAARHRRRPRGVEAGVFDLSSVGGARTARARGRGAVLDEPHAIFSDWSRDRDAVAPVYAIVLAGLVAAHLDPGPKVSLSELCDRLGTLRARRDEWYGFATRLQVDVQHQESMDHRVAAARELAYRLNQEVTRAFGGWVSAESAEVGIALSFLVGGAVIFYLSKDAEAASLVALGGTLAWPLVRLAAIRWQTRQDNPSGGETTRDHVLYDLLPKSLAQSCGRCGTPQPSNGWTESECPGCAALGALPP